MSLKDRLAGMISATGPIPVSAYMTHCLHDPVDGYYATRPGLGADFTTAPEISQIFGELIGGWAAQEWLAIGIPDELSLVEIGPGRGVLMADAMRSTALLSRFHPALRLQLIEASPALQRIQADRLSAFEPVFREGLADVPAGHTLIIANEYLDCLPARQFVKDAGEWRERVVGLGPDGELAFGLAVDRAPQDFGMDQRVSVEIQPGLETLIDELKARAEAGDVFRALFIDYGPDTAAPGDSLRAYQAGKQVSPLAAPGLSDLTVDVDFARLKRLAQSAGLQVDGPVTQSGFLGALGIQQRLDILIKAQPDEAEAVFRAANTLVDPSEMGARFKVICLSSQGLPPPAGFG
ncbi:MAG: SAM-dependent methyltransferase [Pseudomonadota bacterium]